MIISIVAAVIVEQALPTSALAGFARPPVLALIVAYYALNHSVPMMLVAAMLGGILSDGAGALPLGVTSLALAVIGAALYYSRGTIFSGKITTNIVFGAAIGAGMTMMIFSLLLFTGRISFGLQLQILPLKIAGAMVYGAVFFPAIYALLGKLEHLTGAVTLQNDINPDN
jgi:rod shape-determining protein MreD